ncbi:asparagine synthetase B family protein [Catellatospora paridis]|uniref:asparagine synthetase B family protein n=1 Tax=Catellatospora paridis TaxID=1617086 RepID=UPI0012D3D743|nr:asparagine synthase-related protein [Catellatospora paridis]
MGAIAGYVDWTRWIEDEPQVIARLNGEQSPCGQAGAHTWIGPHVALGHARVLHEPAGVLQPVTVHEPGLTVAVVFSGRLHNRDDLRDYLLGHGRRLRTRTDADLVAHAYVHWGSDAVRRLSGHFALAVWDSKEQQLLLARDRLGAVPLYYTATRHGLVFASRMPTLLAHPEVVAELDETGIAELVAMPAAPTPGTALLRGVCEVRPASLVRAHRGGLGVHSYWRLCSQPHEDNLPDTTIRSRELLSAAVGRQLAAESALGALCSGGIGSSALAVLAAPRMRERGLDLATFTFPDDGRGAHERDHRYAVMVAEHAKTIHHKVAAPRSALEESDLRRAAGSAADLPAGADATAQLALLRHAHTVTADVLCGTGAATVFGGHRWLRTDYDRRAGFPWMRHQPALVDLLKASVVAQAQPGRHAYEAYHTALDTVAHLPGETGPARRFREISWLTHTHFLPRQLTRLHAQASAAGVQMCLPYLDDDLVTYAWNIPWEIRTADGADQAILRRTVADLLPRPVLGRRHQPHLSTLSRGQAQVVIKRAQQLLCSTAAPALRLFDRTKVRRLLAEYQHRPDAATAARLQNVVEIDAWLRRHRVRFR